MNVCISESKSVVPHVGNLSDLTMAELWSLWDRYFPRRPEFPNRAHVQSRLTYKLQEQVHGSLDASTVRRLQSIGQRHSRIKLRAPRKAFHFAPGTILMREWDDRVHRVVVNGRGQFEYEGRPYASLTAVARHITGAHRSGPDFFGLTDALPQVTAAPSATLAAASRAREAA